MWKLIWSTGKEEVRDESSVLNKTSLSPHHPKRFREYRGEEKKGRRGEERRGRMRMNMKEMENGEEDSEIVL